MARFGRCGWLLLPKPAEGEGGMLAYGSEARGGDCDAEPFSDELDVKLEEPCDGRPCDDGDWDADSGRDEPGSVTCDWLLGTMPVFRGGSVTELEGSCPEEACEVEGCRSSFIDAEPVSELDDGKPAEEDGCEGRGAA